MAKREKRPTRAEKIERSRLQAQELKVYQSKPWWPVKAMEEATAVEIIGRKLQTIRDITSDFHGEPRDFTIETLSVEDTKEIQEIKKYLEDIPVVYVEKGQAWLEARITAKRMVEQAYDNGDYDDYGDIDTYEEPPLFPEGFFISRDIAELQKLVEILCNEQGALGDAEEIDDRKVERVEMKINIVNEEIRRRQGQVAA